MTYDEVAVGIAVQFKDIKGPEMLIDWVEGKNGYGISDRPTTVHVIWFDFFGCLQGAKVAPEMLVRCKKEDPQ